VPGTKLRRGRRAEPAVAGVWRSASVQVEGVRQYIDDIVRQNIITEIVMLYRSGKMALPGSPSLPCYTCRAFRAACAMTARATHGVQHLAWTARRARSRRVRWMPHRTARPELDAVAAFPRIRPAMKSAAAPRPHPPEPGSPGPHRVFRHCTATKQLFSNLTIYIDITAS